VYAALDARREQLRTNAETRRADRETRRAEYRAQFASTTQERLNAYGDRIAGGMDRALLNLRAVADRVSTRIAAFQDAGADVSAAVAVFNGAGDKEGVYALIEAAQADVLALRTLTDDMVSSEDPKADMAAVREAAQVAKASILLVHEALTETVAELRMDTDTAVVPPEPSTEADASPSTTQ
jgi:hypothetical protein